MRVLLLFTFLILAMIDVSAASDVLRSFNRPVSATEVMSRLSFYRQQGSSTAQEKTAIRKKMLVHSRGLEPSCYNSGESIEDLTGILTRARNEAPETFKWRCDNYRPITKAPFNRAMDGLHRIFQEQAFTWSCSQKLDQYIKETDFYGLKFEAFLEQICLTNMIEDPNAWLVWLPDSYDVQRFTAGQMLPNESIGVYPLIITSDRQVYCDQNFILWQDENKYRPPNSDNDCDVFHVLTKNEYAVFYYQAINAISYPLLTYPHMLGVIPSVVLGGKATAEAGIYESFFDAYCPYASEAMVAFSDWQLNRVNCSHPFIQMREIPCDVTGCHKGYVMVDGREQECSKCGGKGIKTHLPPNTILIKEQKVSLEGDAPTDDYDMVKYISPPFQLVTGGMEVWEKLLINAEWSINVRFTMEAQSGVAKSIDQDNLYAMLSKISNNVYDGLAWKSLWFLELYLMGGKQNAEVPTVNKPKSFVMKSTNQLADEMKGYQQLNGAFPHLSKEKYLEISAKDFGGDPLHEQIAKFLVQFDPYINLDQTAKSVNVEQGVMSYADMFKSANAYSAVNAVIVEHQDGKKWFQLASYEEKRKAVVAKLNEMAKIQYEEELTLNQIFSKDGKEQGGTNQGL